MNYPRTVAACNAHTHEAPSCEAGRRVQAHLDATHAARRDQFAAAALTGLLASRAAVTFEEYAACAMHHADALLAALDAGPQK